MKTTEENLKEAFAGESMANRKYLAFARQAEKDGFKMSLHSFGQQQKQKRFMPTDI